MSPQYRLSSKPGMRVDVGASAKDTLRTWLSQRCERQEQQPESLPSQATLRHLVDFQDTKSLCLAFASTTRRCPVGIC